MRKDICIGKNGGKKDQMDYLGKQQVLLWEQEVGVTRKSKRGHIRKINVGHHNEFGAFFIGDGVPYKRLCRGIL